MYLKLKSITKMSQYLQNPVEHLKAEIAAKTQKWVPFQIFLPSWQTLSTATPKYNLCLHMCTNN